MKKTITPRGFGLIEFKDSKGVECSIQQSSIATEEAIWFGCDDADPQIFIPNGNPSWRKLEKPAEAQDWIFNARMHLTRKQVEKLIPVLQKFVDYGEL
jgi:hypothetical protein